MKMTLPVLNTPIYEMTIPSTKNKIKFRPFLVREEKALLIAKQSEEENVMIETLKSVISSCTFEKINTEKLAVFDLEYMLCQIRSKSVGEISEMKYRCLNCNDPKGSVLIPVDLSKIEVEFNPNHKSDIKLSSDIGIKMKYPGLSVIEKIRDANKNETDIIFETVVDCIDMIYTQDEVFPSSEQSREDLENFINNMTKEQFDKIEDFFDTMPKLNKTVKWKCPVCAFNHTNDIQGLTSFF